MLKLYAQTAAFVTKAVVRNSSKKFCLWLKKEGISVFNSPAAVVFIY
jgi:hypothetical protein